MKLSKGFSFAQLLLFADNWLLLEMLFSVDIVGFRNCWCKYTVFSAFGKIKQRHRRAERQNTLVVVFGV